MTAPVRYTAAEREDIALACEAAIEAGNLGGPFAQQLRDAATLVRQAAAEWQVKRCGTCEHFNVEGPMNGPGQCYAPGHWVQVPPDGSGFCHLHSEGEK